MAERRVIADAVPIARLTVTERMPDGAVITTTGRGRLHPGDDPERAEVRWFYDPADVLFRRTYTPPKEATP